MRRWNNGNGLVAEDAKIDPSVFIGPDCKASGILRGNTVICEGSVVDGEIVDSMICGSAVSAKVVGSVVRRSTVSGAVLIGNSTVEECQVNRFGLVLDSKVTDCTILGKVVSSELKSCKVGIHENI